MRLTARQAAALQLLLAEKKVIEARIVATIRAFLVSAGLNPDEWTGTVAETNGTVELVMQASVDE